MLVKFESSVLCFCQHFLLELYSCNAKLASVSVEPCSYQFQADKIEKMTQDLQTLQRYAGSQQIAWMLGAATGCIVSTAGMNLVFRNPKTGVVRECSLEEITSLEKLDASEIDIAKLGKEVPTDDLELYMRYQKEGSIEHFTDSEKKTISRIETMGIKGDECEEILRARGKEVTRPQIEKPEAVLPPRNESGVKGGLGSKFQDVFNLADNYNLSDDTFNNHILDRHGLNSTYGNKSHFNADFDIRDGIDSTLKGENFVVGPNTAGREGYIFEQTFTNPIGTSSKGKPLYTLKVVIDEAGNVITAFPKK